MWWYNVIPAQGLRLEDCKFDISLNNLDPTAKTKPTSANVVLHFRCGTGDASCLRSWASSQHSQYPLDTCFVPEKSGASLAALVIPMSPRQCQAVLVPLPGAATVRALYSRQ